MIAEPLSWGMVEHSDPVLTKWVATLRDQNRTFEHETGEPPKWLGLFVKGKLMSAVGYTMYPDGTVFVMMMVCAPNKAGRVCLNAIIDVCKTTWVGRRVLWWSQLDNKKMTRLSRALGMTPVAVLWEREA